MVQYVLKDIESNRYFYSDNNFVSSSCRLVDKKEDATIVSKSQAKKLKKYYLQSVIEKFN